MYSVSITAAEAATAGSRVLRAGLALQGGLAATYYVGANLTWGDIDPLCGACGEVPCGDLAARCDGRLLGGARDAVAGCPQLPRRPVPVRGAVAWAVQADVRGRADVHLRGAGEGELAGPRLSVRAGSDLGSGHRARSLALFVQALCSKFA